MDSFVVLVAFMLAVGVAVMGLVILVGLVRSL